MKELGPMRKLGQKEGMKEKALWMHQLIPLLIPSSILLFRLYFYFALLWFALVFRLVLVHVLTSLFKTTSLLIFFFFYEQFRALHATNN